jgi:tRNA threonylcarbamoyladenosine biosynthesis protein TsaE
MKKTVSLAELPDFCEEIVNSFNSRQIVRLDGPLGVGKTQFVKECVKCLGGEVPDSPTFSVINSYRGGSIPIHHVDLYRLESEADIESTGFWDLFSEAQGLIFIEWAQKIPDDQWPRTWQQMHLQITFGQKSNERIYLRAP